MNIIDLKQQILENTQPITDFIIFECQENTFVANQYVEAIVANSLYEPTYISSLDDLDSTADALFNVDTDVIKILKVDEFADVRQDYSKFTNTIVICNKIATQIKPLVTDHIISFKKLKDWQIKDYCKAKCPGLSDENVNWLYTASSGDIYRIDNELSKIALYAKAEQNSICDAIIANSDLHEFNIFDLEKAIITNNTGYVKMCLQNLSTCNFEAMSLANLLLAQYKKILLVVFKSGISTTDLGLSKGEIWHIKQDYFNVSYDKLRWAIHFLSGLDSKLKNGELELSRESFINYIVTNVM